MTSKFLWFMFVVAAQCNEDFKSSPFLDGSEANDFLGRTRRSNRGQLFEEFSQGNMERECIEEACTQEEAYEVFDNVVKGREFWRKYIRCNQSPTFKSEDLKFVHSREQEARIRTARQAGRSERDKQHLRDCLLDTDQCTPFPCVRSNTERCEDRVNNYECFCKIGFTGKRCEHPVNECQSEPCGNFGTCEDEIGGFQCHCDATHEGIQCEKEIEDCRIWGCGRGGECRQSGEGGEYNCVCNEGYKGDTCDDDIDECVEASPCDQDCENTIGAYICSCRGGYILDEKDQTKCNDINECVVTSHGCEESCINTIGAYECTCKKGFELDTLYMRYCEDINECAENNGGCPVIESGCGRNREPCKTCTNVEGDFFCTCPRGFSPYSKGEECVDINECETGQGRNCEHECENYPGGFRCLCREGYKMSYNKRNCLDINECILDHGCEYRCYNKPGRYECSCQRGFELEEDGRGCQDIDECSIGESRCSQKCVNTEGSYTCICDPGYRLVGKYRCSDINECFLSSICDQECENTVGGFICSCRDGYILDTNTNTTCIAINKCDSNPCGENGRCISEINSFRCECFEGFTGDLCEQRSSPCSSSPCLNGGICMEKESSFSCACLSGFSGELCDVPVIICDPGYEESEGICVDIDECRMGTICDHQCTNLLGSYSCSCNEGYAVNGNQCADIDECSTEVCEQDCLNSPGSFVCACTQGFELNADLRTCHQTFQCMGSSYSTLTENHLLLGTNKSDYVVYEIESISSRFTFDLEFRTFDENGILFAMSDEAAVHYIYGALENGKLVFGINLDGSHQKVIDSGDSSRATGTWHRVIIRKKRTRVRLLVDDKKLRAVRATRDQFDTVSLLHYGGIPTASSLSSKLTSDLYLQGCLRRIQHSGIDLGTSQTPGHTGCFQNIQKGTYFKGSGYLLLNADLQGDLRMRFTFRTGDGQGRIVTAISRDGAQFKLEIRGDQVVAELVDTEGEDFMSVYTTTNNQLLCDNIWHVCDFTISSNKIRLHVDGLAAQRKEFTGMRGVAFDRVFPLYLGGHPDSSAISFKGSLQDIKLNNRPLDLSNPTEMIGVSTYSMPAF